MKFTAESKYLSDVISSVVGTTGGSDVNLEVGPKGVLLVKSSDKGAIHHTASDIVVEEGKKDDKATIEVAQFLGLISRRGTVTIEITDKGTLFITNKTIRTEITLPPKKDVDPVESSDNTLELEPSTLAKIQEHIGSLNLVNLLSDLSPTIRLRVVKGTLEMFCADEMHIAYYKMHADTQSDFAIDLPYSELTQLLDVISEDPSTQFAIEESRVYVRNANTKIAFPKSQSGRLITFDAVNSVLSSCIRQKNPSGIKDIDREELQQNVGSCKHIASQETFVELNGHKTKGYSLSYQTTHGRIKVVGAGVNAWQGTDPFKVTPFLLDDFLNTLSLFSQVDIYTRETLLYSYVKQGEDYEAFHSCSGA